MPMDAYDQAEPMMLTIDREFRRSLKSFGIKHCDLDKHIILYVMEKNVAYPLGRKVAKINNSVDFDTVQTMIDNSLSQ